MSDPVSLLKTAYRDLSGVLSSLTVAAALLQGPAPSLRGVGGRRVLLTAERRAPGAGRAAHPGGRPADTTAVDYWTAWRPPQPGDDEELWSTRIAASVRGGLRGVAARYAETSAAVAVAAGRATLTECVVTQGRTLTVADLLSTLTVEAAVHHLDLVLRLDRPAPDAGPLAEVRRVLEGLLRRPLPTGWDDVTAARRGTGREPLDDADRAELGDRAGAFPLFG